MDTNTAQVLTLAITSGTTVAVAVIRMRRNGKEKDSDG